MQVEIYMYIPIPLPLRSCTLYVHAFSVFLFHQISFFFGLGVYETIFEILKNRAKLFPNRVIFGKNFRGPLFVTFIIIIFIYLFAFLVAIGFRERCCPPPPPQKKKKKNTHIHV